MLPVFNASGVRLTLLWDTTLHASMTRLRLSDLVNFSKVVKRKVNGFKAKPSAVCRKRWNRCTAKLYGPTKSITLKRLGAVVSSRRNKSAKRSGKNRTPPTTGQKEELPRNDPWRTGRYVPSFNPLISEIVEGYRRKHYIKKKCTEPSATRVRRLVQYYNLYKRQDPSSIEYKRKFITIEECIALGRQTHVRKVIVARVTYLSFYRDDLDTNAPSRRKFTIVDHTGAISCFAPSEHTLWFTLGDTLLVQNFGLKSGTLVVKTMTKITRRQKLRLSFEAMAVGLKQYKTPVSPIVSFAEMPRSGSSVRVSIRGIVTQVSPILTAKDRAGKDLYKRDITLEADDLSKTVLLRNNAAKYCDIELGNTVTVLDAACVWSSTVIGDALAVMYEDQIAIEQQLLVREPVQLLALHDLNLYNTLGVSVSRLASVDELFINQHMLCFMFYDMDADVEALRKYLPITGSAVIVGSSVTKLNITRYRVRGSTDVIDNGCNDLINGPVPSTSNTEDQVTVEMSPNPSCVENQSDSSNSSNV